MRVAALLVLIMPAAGCDKLFGVDPVTPVIDAVLVDAGPVDVALDGLPTGCRAADILASSDTYLVDEVVRGANDVLHADNNQPVLIKFMVDQAALATTEHIEAFTVTLTLATSGLDCGSNSCAPCGAPAASHYSLYWASSNWAQPEATRTLRNTTPINEYWQVALAHGDMDRSALVTEGPIGGDPILTIPIHASDVAAVPFAPWLNSAGDRITIELETDAALALKSRETSTCNALDPPKVTLLVCPNP